MSDSIEISLVGKTRADVETGQLRLRGAGLDVEWSPVRFDGFGAYVHGTLRMYDTPETVDAKAQAAANAVRSLLDQFEYP